jgi:hypothetical protein
MFFAFLKPIDDHIPAAKLGSLTSLELPALRTPVMLEAAPSLPLSLYAARHLLG